MTGPAAQPWYAALAPGYDIKPLTEEDIPAMLALCEGNPLFYQYCPPPPTAEGIRQDLTALPPGRTLADKHFLGFWQDGRLAAVLDLIEGYPAADTAWIGFFMTARETQGAGIGSAIVGQILLCLKNLGYARAGLAYAKGNPQSRAFWQKNGFFDTGNEKPSAGYTAVVMERRLDGENIDISDRSIAQYRQFTES